jgi:N-methylhydantoinase B
LRLLEKYGRDVFADAEEHMLDHGEQVVRSFLEKIPDGHYVASGLLDSKGVKDDVVPFELTAEVSGSDVLLDLLEVAEQQGGGVNTPVATTVSRERDTLMFLLGAGAHEYVTEGHVRPIVVRTAPGTWFPPASPRPALPLRLVGAPCLRPDPPRALGDASRVGTRRQRRLPVRRALVGPAGLRELLGRGADFGVGHGTTLTGDGSAPLTHVSGSGVRYSPTEVLVARRPNLMRVRSRTARRRTAARRRP